MVVTSVCPCTLTLMDEEGQTILFLQMWLCKKKEYRDKISMLFVKHRDNPFDPQNQSGVNNILLYAPCSPGRSARYKRAGIRLCWSWLHLTRSWVVVGGAKVKLKLGFVYSKVEHSGSTFLPVNSSTFGPDWTLYILYCTVSVISEVKYSK